MKSPILLLSLTLVAVGCHSLPYTEYQGEQKPWPLAASSFVTTISGVPIYYGLPDKPYRVLGRSIAADATTSDLARLARQHTADAVLLLKTDTVQLGTTYEPGFTFYGQGWTYTTPSSSKPNLHTVTVAYLIKFTPTKHEHSSPNV